jgi:glycogen synthase
MKKINVLMLGWYPSPLLSGGLGVASLEIARALSTLVNLSLILPESDPEIVLENIDLTGLNDLDLEELKINIASPQYETFAPVSYVKSDLLPYQTYEQKSEKEKEGIINENSLKSSLPAPAPTILTLPVSPPKTSILEKEIRTGKASIFENSESYGEDLNFKVIQYARYTARLASNKEFDIIYAHDWMTFQAGIEIKMVTGKPLVVHVHSLSYDRMGAEAKGWVHEMEKRALAKADYIIAVSQYTAKILSEQYDIPVEKIVPIYHGLEPISPFRTEKTSAEKLVVFIGRMAEQKGPSYFLEIANKVASRHPEIKFVMAGTGPLLQDLKVSEIAQALDQKLEFTGFLDRLQVFDLLSRADVFCMPSVSEPFGLAALEAAQFGVPVVVSNQAGVSEVLRNALKADYHDSDKMANHILHLLEDDSLRKLTISETFYDIENLTWENTAEEIMDVFLQVHQPVE